MLHQNHVSVCVCVQTHCMNSKTESLTQIIALL